MALKVLRPHLQMGAVTDLERNASIFKKCDVCHDGGQACYRLQILVGVHPISNADPPADAGNRHPSHFLAGCVRILSVATHAYIHDVAWCVQKFAHRRLFANTSARECAIPAGNQANEQR